MDYRLEVLTIPVADVDRAAVFYIQKAGFVLDVDYRPTNDFRVVQLTPAGSACSIQIGIGLTKKRPGSAGPTYLAVTDIEDARRELADRGVAVSDLRHKASLDNWAGDWQAGSDPDHRDYASMADFTDPDGNTWVLQEIGFRPSEFASTSRAEGRRLEREG